MIHLITAIYEILNCRALIGVNVRTVDEFVTRSFSGTALIAGIGRSHKRGRWFVIKQSKSLVVIINFTNIVATKVNTLQNLKEQNEESDHEETDSDAGFVTSKNDTEVYESYSDEDVE